MWETHCRMASISHAGQADTVGKLTVCPTAAAIKEPGVFVPLSGVLSVSLLKRRSVEYENTEVHHLTAA